MKILIAADLVPTSQTSDDFAAGNVDQLFGKVKDLAKGCDRFIVNLECALTKSENAIRKTRFIARKATSFHSFLVFSFIFISSRFLFFLFR